MGFPLFDCSLVASSWITSQMLNKDSVLNAKDVGRDPVNWWPEPGKPAMHDDKVPVGHDLSPLRTSEWPRFL
jgi:hypothetical protein